jgi:hypothetical protein
MIICTTSKYSKTPMIPPIQIPMNKTPILGHLTAAYPAPDPRPIAITRDSQTSHIGEYYG